MILALVAAGLLAGFIDSIAGGGGLITLPALSLVLTAGPHAIGTNKVVGSLAALVALVVYSRGGHFDWRRSFSFAAWVGLGSLGGSLVARSLPLEVFRWLLFGTCPIILWVVWRKDFWVAREEVVHPHLRVHAMLEPGIILSGLACGFYDGVWGPGGGTFMFLALLFVARLPLLTALAASKLANTCSAGVALVSYAQGGYVHWMTGLPMAIGVSVGALIGATHANRRAADAVRPALVGVVALLLARLAFGS
jgi:uncharacterized protein